MDLKIIPDMITDLTDFGICKQFDTKKYPGYVLCQFENGQLLKLTRENFNKCRFRVAAPDDEGEVDATVLTKEGMMKLAPEKQNQILEHFGFNQDGSRKALVENVQALQKPSYGIKIR